MQIDQQVLYLGRWVSKEHFRTFIYNGSEQKLVESYAEYERELASGLWFASPDDVVIPKAPVNIRTGRKAKDGSSNS